MALNARLSVRSLMILVALCVPFLLLARAVHDARHAARRAQCCGHLSQLGLALHNYNSAYGTLPPASIADSRGRPMHSWRVLILPFIEEQALYESYTFNEPWDGPGNRLLAGRMPRIYSCPNHDVPGQTSYVALAGPGTLFPANHPTTLMDVPDGAQNTILHTEAVDDAIGWMEPRDLDIFRIAFTINGPTRPGISSRDSPGAHFLFADGAYRLIGPSTPPETIKALATRNGGEAVIRP
jgi:hypothetical protein